MSKVIRKIFLIGFSMILAVCLCFGLVACKDPTVPATYTITVEQSEHGAITSNVSEAKEGDEITLTVSPDAGYVLSQLLVNGVEKEVTGSTFKFAMPAENVVVKGTFELKVPVPSDYGFALNSTAQAGATATSYWDVVYGASGLEVSVTVKDLTVIATKDGVALYVGRKGYDYVNLSEVNFGVKVLANGTVEQYAVTGGAYATTSDGVFTASAQAWTGEGSVTFGYKVTLAVEYEALGLTAENAQGEITVLPALINSDTASSAFPATTATYGGSEIANPGSYFVLESDNTLTENDYAGGMGQLGSSSKIEAGKYWDLSKDYAKEDKTNYPNREVTLSGHDGNDNNLVFWRTEGSNAYAKATIRVDSILVDTERWGKFGLMLYDGANKTGVFFYVDAFVGNSGDVNVGNINGTAVGYNIGEGDWTDWNGIDNTDGSFNKSTKTITMAMTYIDGVVRMYVGENLVKEITYVSKGDVALGIKSFGYGLTVTNYESSGDPTDEGFLKEEHSITVTQYDGVTVSVPQKAKLGDTVSFTINAGSKVITHVYVNYAGNKIELFEGGSGYSFTMPDTAVTITIEFENLLSVDITAVSDKLEVDITAPSAGQEVTFTAKEGWVIAKLYANLVEIKPVDGVYKLVVNENVVITGEFYMTAGGVVLDGERDEAYGEATTVAKYDDDRTITVSAVRTEAGVWIHVVARMNTMKNTESDWYLNTNFEFQLNASGQRYVNIKGQSVGITNHIWKTTRDGEKYVYTVEIYIANDLVNSDSDVRLNYAWKTGGEEATLRGDYLQHSKYYEKSDWLAFHGVGGINGDSVTALGQGNSMPDNLYIGRNGIIVRPQQATDATIDGNLNESKYQGEIIRGDAGIAQFTFTGFAGSDGLYIGITITHNAWSSAGQSDWSRNDNLEMRVNSQSIVVMWIGGELALPSIVTQAKAVTVNGAGGKLVTTLEMFIAGTSDVYSFQVGANGEGFVQWQSLIWDSNIVYFSANGISETDPSLANSGIEFDGEFSESIWTKAASSKVTANNVNGATVEVMAINADAGVLIGVTITHTNNSFCQNDGSEWWHWMNFEFRLAGTTTQFAVGVFNGKTTIGDLQAGVKTVSNGSNYTTTMEILVKYSTINKSATDNIDFVMGGVYESGFQWLFDANETNPRHQITNQGIVTK